MSDRIIFYLLSTVALGTGNVQKGMQGINREKLESFMDELRGKYGQNSITLGYQENKDIGTTRGGGLKRVYGLFGAI